jgi:peptidoglycan hydrolase CwlO-like protein
MSNAQKGLSWAAVAVGLTVVTTLSGWVWGTSAASTTLQRHDQQIERLEAKQQQVENSLTEIKTDVKWIRERLGK